MNYGDYRSAREQAKIDNKWRPSYSIIAALTNDDEKTAAKRDWWLSVDLDTLSKEALDWNSQEDACISSDLAKHTSKRWKLSYYGLRLITHEDMDISELVREWCLEIVGDFIARHLSRIEVEKPELLNVIAQYQAAAKTPIRSKERLACLAALETIIQSSRRDWLQDLQRAMWSSLTAEESNRQKTVQHYLSNSDGLLHIGRYNHKSMYPVYNKGFQMKVLQTYKEKMR